MGPAILAVVLSVLLVAGCTSELPATDRRDVTLDGETWSVLLAPPEGMRGRADFDGADGMLFDLGETTHPGAVVFVMDGVAFPLDVGWFAEDGAFLGWASMDACAQAPCPHYQAPAPFRWAIEAPPGAFDDLSARPGLEVAP